MWPNISVAPAKLVEKSDTLVCIFIHPMLRRSLHIFILSITTFVCLPAVAQLSSLRTTIKHIAKSLPADVGVSAIDLETNDTLTLNGNQRFPMQSVFKFHIGLAALHHVDNGKLSLDQKYNVTKAQYFDTWSVLMRSYPQADVEVTLRDLITWTVMNSDNVACDMLFDILGSPKQVEQFINRLGINDIAITANEREMHREWSVQFENWTTPNAMAGLLKLFAEGKILKQESNALLWKLMTETPNAPKRL